MPEHPFHVAIIGGGLCGLSLAIALTKRSISHTIYESHSSFTEIGAGINLGPNTIQAFDLIDPAISEKVYGLATRNAHGEEDVWMNVRLGAPTEKFEDAHLVTQILAPPTGNMSVSRNELLQLLASSISPERARFNKKLSSVKQGEGHATMSFEDGTQEKASIVIGCDGAHSTVRRLMLGDTHPATKARFSEAGVYRAVFPMQLHERVVGADKAHMSTLWTGPEGYMINYPIDGGNNVNIGIWPSKPGSDWKYDDAWVIPQQKQAMLQDFKVWGPTLQKIMSSMGDETSFWASFHHSVRPESYYKGCVCIIGDAAHSMCPHQGQGAAQSMEDACVMAEVLRCIDTSSVAYSISEQVKAAFSSWEVVRRDHFERVQETSYEAFSWWANFWRPGLSENELEVFARRSQERFHWIWNSDIAGQGERARSRMKGLLTSGLQHAPREHAKLA